VQAMRIRLVPFFRFGNALFLDENCAPHALEGRPVALPRRGYYCEFFVRRGQMRRARSAARPT
jgi:hypothetical protein